MARTVKEHEYTEKRTEILAAARRLVFSKGYARMTVQDILAELQISSGAFYHYFDSKPAVLEALVEWMQQEVEEPLLLIVQDPRLSALEKLQRFFATLDRLRAAYKAEVVELLRVWYTDENALVRLKVDAAVAERRAPLLNEIVRQGIREGVFTTAAPDYAGEIILSLIQGMGNTHAMLLLSLEQEGGELRCVESILASHAAYMLAIERVLGAPPDSLGRLDAGAVKVWVAALRADA